jgi:hypothetical protein
MPKLRFAHGTCAAGTAAPVPFQELPLDWPQSGGDPAQARETRGARDRAYASGAAGHQSRDCALGGQVVGGNRVAGAAGDGVTVVIRAIAALALITASAHSLAASAPKGDALSSTAPWWEKVTVTIAGNGKAQSCRYESSLRPEAGAECDVTGDQASMAEGSGGSNKSDLTRITFERRFTPGPRTASAEVQPGETLLGQQVMALAIDSAGSVKGCKVVSAAGAMTPDYGCKDAAAEKFEASAAKATATGREGVMTILVYGHAEHVV